MYNVSIFTVDERIQYIVYNVHIVYNEYNICTVLHTLYKF